MKDFEGKRIKLNLNVDSGWTNVSGAFIKMENNFIVIYNEMLKKIQYFSLYSIRSIEILKDIEED